MVSCPIAGYSSTFTAGDFFYFISIGLACCMLIAGLMMRLVHLDEDFEKQFIIIRISVVIGLLYGLYLPWGWALFLVLHLILAEVGRTGQCAMGVVTNIVCWCSLCYFLVPPDLMKKVRC